MFKKALSCVLIVMCCIQAYSITLIENGRSKYCIITSVKATSVDIQASQVLQKYLEQISGARISIISDQTLPTPFEIVIGKTNRSEKINYTGILNDGFIIETISSKLIIIGSGKGTLYGVYTFLEEFLGCKKYTANFKVIPALATISIPSIKKLQNPQLNFRSVYYKDPETDQEYLDWHKLNRIEDKWGLWGHSFFKLVPPRRYFESHPEYFGLVDGKRQAMQLCLTNPEVLKIVIEDLEKKIKESPDMTYWSVSQNDDVGGCECENCTALNEKYNSAQGSLLTFVNHVAAAYPDKIISTLAYTYTRKPPEGLKPLRNVNILISDIEINRSKPVEADPRSEAFRKDYEGWQKLTNNIIIWDYVVQFTHYISPFPNLNTLKPNLNYFTKSAIEGFFIQGSVETAGEFSELRTYVLSKLLWNPKADQQKLEKEFISAYYGKAGRDIENYINLLHENAQKSARRMDIYDNPIMPYNTYLTPRLISEYSIILARAAAAVENDTTFLNRVLQAWMPLDFAVLQQARFYGIDLYGVFEYSGKEWVVRTEIRQKLNRFIAMLKQFGVTQLNESGLTPDEYAAEWNTLFMQGPRIHKALNEPVTLLSANDQEFVSKGARTLVDGVAGNSDFQYNWLGWYGNNMEVVVDLQAVTEVRRVKISFLENHRHNMFLPSEVRLDISRDGKEYKPVSVVYNSDPTEGSKERIKENLLELGKKAHVRYIKVTAINQKELPLWRKRKDRKPWVLADEIIVE